MEKSKVVTFRIDESMLEQIDAIVKKQRYMKRSNVIAAAIAVMIELDKRNLSGRALYFYPKFDEVTKLEFEVQRRKIIK